MSEMSATVMATPALGPSFGMAPAGTWMWMSLLANSASSMPSERARDLTSDSAPARSPSSRRQLAGEVELAAARGARASMNRMSPPAGVRRARSRRQAPRPHRHLVSKRGAPRMAVSSSGPISTRALVPSAMRIAALRRRPPIMRSSVRTRPLACSRG